MQLNRRGGDTNLVVYDFNAISLWETVVVLPLFGC